MFRPGGEHKEGNLELLFGRGIICSRFMSMYFCCFLQISPGQMLLRAAGTMPERSRLSNIFVLMAS
jgi:hypothetical protein